MNESDRHFLQRRRRLARSWNLVGVALLSVLVATTATLYFRVPLLANPLYVLDLLKDNNLEPASMELMAVILPIVFLICLGAVAVTVGFGFAMFANERRYLAIIDTLERGGDPKAASE
jgi:membrane-anchored protein YejM (alkaline phosphatase superfamily)